jgi:hypothetical protein
MKGVSSLNCMCEFVVMKYEILGGAAQAVERMCMHLISAEASYSVDAGVRCLGLEEQRHSI